MSLLNKLWADLTDRRGFRQEMENVDDDIQKEWKAKWQTMIDAELASLSAPKPQTEWRPISEAEKEGQIIGANPMWNFTVALVWNLDLCDWTDHNGLGYSPTLFRPLPAPPVEGTKEDRK